MDPFTFKRQTLAFLSILAVLELLIVLVFPVLAIVLAVIALFLMVFVWLKAGIRTRKWLWWNPGNVPLTQAEGAIAVSAALLLTCGVLVGGIEAVRYASGERTLLAGYAFRHMLGDTKPGAPAGRPVGRRGTHYSNSDMQMALKTELAKAGIPFEVETKDGKEFVMWAPEHNAAVEEIQGKVVEGLPAGRTVHFDKPVTRQAFKEWLAKRGVAYETTTRLGKEYVTWKDGSPDLAIEFLKEHYMPCPQDTAAAGPTGQAGC